MAMGLVFENSENTIIKMNNSDFLRLFRKSGESHIINIAVDGKNIDVVMSDMAANMTGNESADSARSMYLVELALEMCSQVLKPNGAFVVKVFQGAGFEQFMKDVRLVFSAVKTRKPESSRARSREVYLVATGYKG